MGAMTKVGVLALQGDFREHVRVLTAAGAVPVEVRTPAELADVDRLVIPGGESTTIAKLAHAGDLVHPLQERARDGMPILGTCAGMIVLAERVLDGEPLLSLMDVTVRRNAYGAALAYGPVLATNPRTRPMLEAVLKAALGGDAPIARELGLEVARRTGSLRVRYEFPTGTHDPRLPRLLEVAR